MTEERRKVEQLEAEIKALAAAVTALDKTSAVRAAELNGKLDGLVTDVKDAKTERQAIQVEMRTMGNEVLKLSNTIKDQGRTLDKIEPAVAKVSTLESTVAEIEPKVDAQEGRYQQAVGAGKLAKLLYAIGGALAAGGAGFVAWISQRN